MNRITKLLALVLLLASGACREDDGIVGGGGPGRAFIQSDPIGATIFVDDRSTGRTTPDTVRGLGGRREITVRLDSAGFQYGYTARVNVTEDTLLQIAGPLVLRCVEPACYRSLARYRAGNRVRFSTNPNGILFLHDATGGGILWPSSTSNSYASAGMPVVAGLLRGRDTVALGLYDAEYLAGRPAPEVNEEAGVSLRQSTWVVPPPSLLDVATIRGIAVEERLTAVPDRDDIILIELVFRNITNQPVYGTVDPALPAAGVTYDELYLGFVLDPDIGRPGDDYFSYEPALDLVFAYDADFQEVEFGSNHRNAPGLVGLSVVAAPAGARVVLNGWVSPGDWRAGQFNEPIGWYILSGTQSFAPDHPSTEIGHLAQASADVRLSVSVGPLQLTPGDSASLTVAVTIAPPVAGTFESGTEVIPGDPLDSGRQLFRVAGNLFVKTVEAGLAPGSAAGPAKR